MKEEAGIRHNEGKTKWAYLHYPSLKGIVDSLVEGYESGRYEKYNWKKGMTTVEVCESLLRHVHAYLDGEDMDGDTGIRHIDRIGSNQHILSHTDLFKPQFDNRECKESIKIKTTKISLSKEMINQLDSAEDIRKEFFKDLEDVWYGTSRQECENNKELKCTKGVKDVKPESNCIHKCPPYWCEMNGKCEYVGDSKNTSEDEY